MCEACDFMEENGNAMNKSQVANYVQEQVENVTSQIPMIRKAAMVEERERIISLLKANRDLDNELIDSIIDLVRGDIDV